MKKIVSFIVVFLVLCLVVGVFVFGVTYRNELQEWFDSLKIEQPADPEEPAVDTSFNWQAVEPGMYSVEGKQEFSWEELKTEKSGSFQNGVLNASAWGSFNSPIHVLKIKADEVNSHLYVFSSCELSLIFPENYNLNTSGYNGLNSKFVYIPKNCTGNFYSDNEKTTVYTNAIESPDCSFTINIASDNVIYNTTNKIICDELAKIKTAYNAVSLNNVDNQPVIVESNDFVYSSAICNENGITLPWVNVKEFVTVSNKTVNTESFGFEGELDNWN